MTEDTFEKYTGAVELKIESLAKGIQGELASPILGVKIPGPNKPPKAKRKPKAKVKAPAKRKTAKKPTKGKSKRAPRTFDPAKLDVFGFRKGSIKSQAATMYQAGATLADVKAKVGSVQFNVLTQIEALGFTVKTKVIKNGNGRDASFYKVSKKAK